MPPFRAGLLKRKIESDKSSQETSQKSSEDESIASDEDLLRGEIEAGDDATDSEHEGEADSDREIDEVLFDNDADSTLGDDHDTEEASDASSEITDSEADDDDDDEEEEGEESDDEGEESDNDQAESSADSGTESGIIQTGSSDETDKATTTKQGNELLKQKKKIIKQKKEENEKNSVDLLADKIRETSMQIKPVVQKDEYESGDTSDEEDRINTRGDVPAWWYKEYPHVGYDLDAKKIMRPTQRDHIDEFLKKCEDPDFWRTVQDPATGQDIVLSTEDLQLIARLREGKAPNAEHDPYEPWVEWFTRDVLKTPLRAFPEHKRSFLPSRTEQKQIGRIVHALKMGWMKTRKQIAQERKLKKERKLYDLWGSSATDEATRSIHRHIPAPKRPPPSHAESYNPPKEYLLDSKELKEWNKLSTTPWKRKYTFLPTSFPNLRSVPAYERFVRERFLRCLDLYLAPRAIHMRLTIQAQDLVPKLPSPRDLQPFPTSEVLTLRGHSDIVRAADFDPCGQYIVSASDDCSVKVWETSTGRCLRTIILPEAATRVRWTPAVGLSLVAVACGHKLLLINPGSDIGAHKTATRTDELLEEPPPQHDTVMDSRTTSCVSWDKVTPEDWARGIRLSITHFRPVTNVQWHNRGDYLCVTLSDAASRAVVVHQISRRRSQLPLSKSKGLVQCAVFLPTRPHLAVATQRAVRIYDLVKQELVRRLVAGAQWISSLCAHPAGDHLLVATYERKCLWFDLELSSSPYQTLRLHGSAVRAVTFHPRYPLFATGGDDNYIVVSHGMVYNDLLQNPLIVPVKQLPAVDNTGTVPTNKNNKNKKKPVNMEESPLKVLDLVFHPRQPWLLAARADHTLALYA